jgi:hypothetical protein
MGADYPTTLWEQWEKGYPDNGNHRGAVSARSNGEQLDSPGENPGWKSEDL